MENVGPEFLVGVGLCVLLVIVASVAWDFRAKLWRVMSSLRAYTTPSRAVSDRPILADLPEQRNGETAGNGVAAGKDERNDPFLFPGGFTMLARQVLAKKVNETDALRLAVGVSPGKSPRYAEARRRLHLAMAQEAPDAYPPRPEPQPGALVRPKNGWADE